MKKNSSVASPVMICCYFVIRVIAVVVGYKGLGIVVVHRDLLVAVVVRKDWAVVDSQHRVLAETRQG